MFKNLFPNNPEGKSYFEIFFISAVSTILITRFYLHLASYPQVGGGGLHIAHMLWGGLLMLTSIFLLFSFTGRFIFFLASLLSGIGFGLFIDELGKFLTSDNNYFFEPTIALIYVIFVILYLFFHLTQKNVKSRETNEGNFIDFIFGKVYAWFFSKRIVTRLVVSFFVLYSIFNLYRSADVISLYFRLNEFSLSYIDLGQFLSSILASVMVIFGVVALRFSKVRGYRMFRLSILTSIFLTQFFDFYNNQFEALLVLFFNFLVLLALDYILKREIQKEFA